MRLSKRYNHASNQYFHPKRAAPRHRNWEPKNEAMVLSRADACVVHAVCRCDEHPLRRHGKILADRLTWYMQRLKTPNGLKAIGYSSSDIPALVEGTLPQHRVTKLSPRPFDPEELAALFEDAMTAW